MFRSPLLHLCAVVSLLAACSSPTGYINAYKIDIQQGNVLTQEMVAQLKPGQTREQVRYILGTPLLTDIFHQQRWDYVYSYRNGRTGVVETRQFSVFFDKDNRPRDWSISVPCPPMDRHHRCRRRRGPVSSRV